jgi:glycyl-tRNA synthetase
MAQDIRKVLKEDFAADYDQAGAIGRRYRRQDEAGTPFCVTVDYQSKEDNTVTLRFRDSMEQVRLPKAELTARLRQEIKAYKRAKCV